MNASELTAEFKALQERADNQSKLLDQQAIEIKALRDQLHAAEIKIAQTQKQLDGHIAQFEKWDARRWTATGLVIAGLITLVANLVLLFVKGSDRSHP